MAGEKKNTTHNLYVLILAGVFFFFRGKNSWREKKNTTHNLYVVILAGVLFFFRELITPEKYQFRRESLPFFFHASLAGERDGERERERGHGIFLRSKMQTNARVMNSQVEQKRQAFSAELVLFAGYEFTNKKKYSRRKYYVEVVSCVFFSPAKSFFHKKKTLAKINT